jgi:DNA-directed RNA polymerase subunit RPC12/RpoP
MVVLQLQQITQGSSMDKTKDTYTCPECGSPLIVVRVDDALTEYEVDKKSGILVDIGSKSNGSTQISCSKDVKHQLRLSYNLEAGILDQL